MKPTLLSNIYILGAALRSAFTMSPDRELNESLDRLDQAMVQRREEQNQTAHLIDGLLDR